MKDLKKQIQSSINAFSDDNIQEIAKKFFNTLGYQSNRTGSIDKEFLLEKIPHKKHDRVKIANWKSANMLFQLTIDEVQGKLQLFDIQGVINELSCVPEKERHRSWEIAAL